MRRQRNISGRIRRGRRGNAGGVRPAIAQRGSFGSGGWVETGGRGCGRTGSHGRCTRRNCGRRTGGSDGAFSRRCRAVRRPAFRRLHHDHARTLRARQDVPNQTGIAHREPRAARFTADGEELFGHGRESVERNLASSFKRCSQSTLQDIYYLFFGAAGACCSDGGSLSPRAVAAVRVVICTTTSPSGDSGFKT